MRGLTPAARRWLEQFSQGKSHAEISRTLGISVASSRHYVWSVGQALGLDHNQLGSTIQSILYDVANKAHSPMTQEWLIQRLEAKAREGSES